LDRLGDVHAGDLFAVGEIGDRPRDLQDPVVGARDALTGSPSPDDERLRVGGGAAMLGDFADRERALTFFAAGPVARAPLQRARICDERSAAASSADLHQRVRRHRRRRCEVDPIGSGPETRPR
jgi:hypothetical protein